MAEKRPREGRLVRNSEALPVAINGAESEAEAEEEPSSMARAPWRPFSECPKFYRCAAMKCKRESHVAWPTCQLGLLQH